MTDTDSRLTLLAKGISKRFGGVHALSDVGFTIGHGEIYGLIGPNGAGKTSLFNVLTGIYQQDEGEFIFDSQPLTGLKPNEVAERGIARTFQNIRLFANLSALENMIGRHVRTHASVVGAISRREIRRGEGDREARIRTPRPRRRRETRVASEASRPRRPAPARDRARAGNRAQPSLDGPRGNGATETGPGSLDGIRRRHDDPADRARHEARDERLRPRTGAGLRQEDRRKAPQTLKRPEGDRCVSRWRNRCT